MAGETSEKDKATEIRPVPKVVDLYTLQDLQRLAKQLQTVLGKCCPTCQELFKKGLKEEVK